MGWLLEGLEGDALAATVLGSERFCFSNETGVYECEGETVRQILPADLASCRFGVHRLHHDSTGAVYFCTRSDERLLRRPAGEDHFHVVCEDLRGTIRGFQEMPDCTIYAGRYSQQGPAQLLKSRGGETWEVAWEWAARHIHDVRRSPFTGWLYVVVGEGDPKRTEDSHAIYRSKDGGASFRQVYKAKRTRPLFLPINFYEQYVLAGTDHREGNNFIVAMRDDGDDLLGRPEVLFRLPVCDGSQVHPFAYCLEWLGGTLFAGTRGQDVACLFASDDLHAWRCLQMVSGTSLASTAFINFSRPEPESQLLIISGFPGIKITALPGPTIGGLSWTPGQADDEPGWVREELVFR